MATAELGLDEAARRMPTLTLIDDGTLRKQTAELTAEAPDYFWEVPASTTNYHHPICRKERGLWVHTLMLSTVIERLGDTYVEQGRLDERDIDLAHAAAILHDQRKNGDPANPQNKSTSDHELRMAAVIEDSPLPNAVADAVRSHMGSWYDGPAPDSELADLVHTADMIASTETITPAIAAPIPEELSHFDLQATSF